MKRLGALVALGVMTALAPAAQAQFCTTMCSRYESGECVEHTQTCTTPSAPAYSYGAIAYGRTSHAYGYSYKWGSRAKAESEALKTCAAHGNDCESMVWFDRECGAVAQGDGATAFWGLGDGEGAARGDALGKCQKSGTKKCVVRVSACSR